MSTYLAQRLTHDEQVTVHPRSELSAARGTSRLSALNWRDNDLRRPLLPRRHQDVLTVAL